MNTRVKDKIEEIETYLSELTDIIPEDFKEYKKNTLKKAACERYFEKIVEAGVDLAFLFIREKKFKSPEEDKEAFDILAKEKIISEYLAERLKDAKRMRNILAHKYGKVNDKIVFTSVKEELEKDIKEFISKLQEQKKSKNGKQ